MKKTILNGLLGLTLMGGGLMVYRVYEYYTGKGQQVTGGKVTPFNKNIDI